MGKVLISGALRALLFSVSVPVHGGVPEAVYHRNSGKGQSPTQRTNLEKKKWLMQLLLKRKKNHYLFGTALLSLLVMEVHECLVNNSYMWKFDFR